MQLFSVYWPIGPSRKQGCDKTEPTGSLQPMRVGLVGRSAVKILGPQMVRGVTVTSSKMVTWETKWLQIRFAIMEKGVEK